MDRESASKREIEELLPRVKVEELRRTLQEKYYQLLKKKLKKESEETESEESESEAEPEKEEKKEVKSEEKAPNETEKEEEKLHGIKKFKIDEETIDKLLKSHHGQAHEFFIHLADSLPKYFENDEEMRKYIKNKCYVALRVKAKFTKDGDEKEEQEDEYFVPHHHKRRYLAQSLEDLREIMLDQVPKIEGEIGEFVRNGSGYILTGIKSVKLEVTPFKPGIRKARGYIELYPWLRRRKAVVNIRNKDGMCFWKCLYHALNGDKWRHDYRDVPEKKLMEFMEQRGFDAKIFEEGYTMRALATFEEKYKISINVYVIGVNGPEETKQYYCSIYDPGSVAEKVDLGIIRNDKGNVHFVLVKKLGIIFTKAYDKNCGHVKVCRGCGQVCKTTERLLQHYKEDHKDETMKKQILILLKQDEAWVKFNMQNSQDFSKTLRYFFVCYADFECSNIPSLEMKTEKTRILTRQIPNSFMVFCPDLLFLEDERKLRIETYLKKFQSDDPYRVLEEFIRALDTIRKTCIFRWQSHPRLPKLTKEEQEKYDAAEVCEKCNKPFDARDCPKVRHHCHVIGKYVGAWCRRCNYLEGKKKLKLVYSFIICAVTIRI
jgi:hypothetical protein